MFWWYNTKIAPFFGCYFKCVEQFDDEVAFLFLDEYIWWRWLL